MYYFPSTIEELQEKDKYQILYPMSKLWGEIKEYSSNMCKTKKDNIEHLIKNKRIRVIKI